MNNSFLMCCMAARVPDRVPPFESIQPLLKPLGSEPVRLHNLTYMHTSPENDYPRQCIEVGLSCEACTGETARQLAAVCKGLKGKMIGQLFVQIYPRSACARMHSHFAEAYCHASSCAGAAESEPGHIDNDKPNHIPNDTPAIPRRGPAPERRRVMIAAA